MPKLTETDDVARFVFVAEQVCVSECMCMCVCVHCLSPSLSFPVSLSTRVPVCECEQEVGHVDNPNDGLFWMDWSEAVNYFWAFTVCKVKTDGKRKLVPLSQAKCQARQAQQQISGFDRVRHSAYSTWLGCLAAYV